MACSKGVEIGRIKAEKEGKKAESHSRDREITPNMHAAYLPIELIARFT